MTSYLRLYTNAKKIVWWLSVDNYFLNYGTTVSSIKGKILMFLRKLKRQYYYNNKALTLKELLGIEYHWFQSKYAHDTLIESYNIKGQMLGDYLEDGIINNNSTSNGRKNIILYNPKKGFGETKKIIEFFQKNCTLKYEFVPLVGYNRRELTTLFLESKIYIDFGYHPGKDRMPREAVINGCVVITNKQGSAANSNDVPIKDQYKIGKIDGQNLGKVLSLILSVFENFDKHSFDFEGYRDSVRSEEGNFKKDLEHIISNLQIK